jgi:prolyl-tRNA synthetase
MLWSQSHIPTRRDPPTGATAASHQFLVRSGLLREQSPGVIEFLPLGVRVLGKLAIVAKEALTAVGATEIQISQTASQVEALESILAAIRSSEALPNRRFLFHACVNDDSKPNFFRPSQSPCFESFGIRRLEETPGAGPGLRSAFEGLFSRLGIPIIAAESGRQPIILRPSVLPGRAGGAAMTRASTGDPRPTLPRSTEGGEKETSPLWSVAPGMPATAYFAPSDAGDDLLLRSDRGDYAAIGEVAETGSRPWTFGEDSAGELEKVHTPGLKSVAEVAAFFSVPRTAILKTLVFRTDAQGPALSSGVNAKWVVAVVRGDDRVNFTKLANVVRETFHVSPLPLPDESQDAGLKSDWPIGFVGPDAAMRKPDAVLVIDYDAAQGASWVAGANEADHHVRHFNWFRECGDRLADLRKTAVADIRYARAGDPAPRGGLLMAVKGFEVGQALGFGTPLPARTGRKALGTFGMSLPEPIVAFEIDFFRLLVAAVEHFHDDRGILWPAAIAPFSAVVTALGYKGDTKVAAERIYEQLNAAGIDTILDDRAASPGVKFADADLIGFAVRITIGQRGLKDGVVEVKARRNAEAARVPADAVVEAVRAALVHSGANIS